MITLKQISTIHFLYDVWSKSIIVLNDVRSIEGSGEISKL